MFSLTSPSSLVGRILILVCLGLVTAPLPGQEPDQPAETDTSESGQVPEVVQDAWDHLIYLPYRNLKSVYEREGSSVMLPYLEYLKLWQDARQQSNSNAPIDALITRAEYTAVVEQDLVRISAKFAVESLRDEWAKIPLQFGEAAVGSIKSEGNEVLLQGTGDGTYVLLIPRSGKWSVELELAARILTSPDGRSFEFGCPTVGISTLELAIPETDQTVAIRPRLISLPVTAGDGETRIKASLGATRQIAASWSPRSSEKPEMELLASVQNLLQVNLSEGLIHRDARLTYSVLRGELEQVRLVVPAADRVLDVSAIGTRVKGWRSASEDGQQIITVELLSPVRKQLVIEVHTEKTLGMEETIPTAGRTEAGVCFGIHALDVIRESGQLVVSHAEDLSVAYDPPSGLTRINPEEVDPKAIRENAVYYRFYSSRFELQLTARPVQPRLTAAQSVSLTIDDDQLTVQSQWAIEVERAGVFGFEWTIPEGLLIRSVVTEGLDAFRVDEESNRLIVTLKQKVQGSRQVIIRGVVETDPTSGENLVLPLLEMTNAEVESGTIQLFAPPSIEVNTQQDELIGVQPAPPGNQISRGSAVLVAAWTYGKRPASVTIRATRKSTRLSATVATRVEISEDLASVRTLAEFEIEHAGLDRLMVRIPESVSENATIEVVSGAALKEKIAGDAAENGWVPWTLVLQEEVIGRQVFEITYDLPEPPEDAEQRSFSMQPAELTAVDREDGESVPVSQLNAEVEVARNRALSLKIDATGGDVESIDIRELSLAMPANQGSSDMITTSAFRYHEQPVTLSITTEKHEIQEVVETVIPRTLMEIVIGSDPLASFRCRYRIITSERQRLRVDLPANVELIEPRLDNTKIALEKAGETEETDDGWDSYFVNVSRSKTSDEPFYLTLQFRAPITPPDETPMSVSWGGDQFVRLPVIRSAEGQNVAMQEVRVAVWVPERVSLVGQPDRFVGQQDSNWFEGLFGSVDQSPLDNDLTGWIGFSSLGLIEFPTEGRVFVYDNLGGSRSIELRWWMDFYLVWVLSGTFVVIGWIIRRTSWENKLGMILFIGFGCSLYSFEDSDLVLQGLRAARYGLGAMLVYWILHLILGPRSHSPMRDSLKTYVPAYPGAVVIPPPGIFDEQRQQLERHSDD